MVSCSFVHLCCVMTPSFFLFGASSHPYTPLHFVFPTSSVGIMCVSHCCAYYVLTCSLVAAKNWHAHTSCKCACAASYALLYLFFSFLKKEYYVYNDSEQQKRQNQKIINKTKVKDNNTRKRPRPKGVFRPQL